jgi:chorismate synthase
MEGSAFSLAGPHAGVAREEDVAGARADVSSLVVRRLASHEDYAAAVELQRLIWGQSFRDVVPTAILKVTQRVGGVTAGAFDPDGDLVGFVYGLTGFYDGRLVHWSHMLGVRPELRDHGIGRRLKEFQRELLAEAGIEWIYWTFDPLVARNAHLNFNRLNVEVREYVPDMYGDTGSELHSFGTDRFVVAWAVRSGEQNGAGRRATSAREVPLEAPVLNNLDDEGFASATRGLVHNTVLVEVPCEIELMTPAEARAWRAATRRSFRTAMQAGYEVSGFYRDSGDRCLYILSHSD